VGQFGFAMHPFFFALFCRQLRVLIAPLGGGGQTPVSGTPLLGCATPEDQSPTVALLWAFGERLSGLLKEPFTHAGRQLQPEGDELLKIGIDCAQFCAACVALCGDRRFSRGLLQLFESPIGQSNGTATPIAATVMANIGKWCPSPSPQC